VGQFVETACGKQFPFIFTAATVAAAATLAAARTVHFAQIT
jgi:hypothetical protein